MILISNSSEKQFSLVENISRVLIGRHRMLSGEEVNFDLKNNKPRWMVIDSQLKIIFTLPWKGSSLSCFRLIYLIKICIRSIKRLLNGQINMANKKDEGSHIGCGRPSSICLSVDDFAVDSHILCSHRKVWMTYLDKGLYIHAIFETMTGCSPNVTENISWLRSQIMSPLKFLQVN